MQRPVDRFWTRLGNNWCQKNPYHGIRGISAFKTGRDSGRERLLPSCRCNVIQDTESPWKNSERTQKQEEAWWLTDEADDAARSFLKKTHKDVSEIISRHHKYFSGLSHIDSIEIIGHSMNDIDMPYYEVIRRSVREDAKWTIYWHSPDDKEAAEHLVSHLNLTCYEIRRWSVSYWWLTFYTNKGGSKRPTLKGATHYITATYISPCFKVRYRPGWQWIWKVLYHWYL